MRKKVTIAAMANGDLANPPEVPPSSATLQSQKNEFRRSVKLLSGAARSTAQKLHAIDYLQGSPPVVTKLILEINALATILSGLEDDLLLEGVSGATDRTLMWTKEHHKNLTSSIEECDDVLRAFRRAVWTADEEFRIVASQKKANDYIEHFRLDDGPQVLETIVRCSHLVSNTRVLVRHTALSRIESLSDDEIHELLRLTQALQHPDLHAIWARKDETFTSRQMQRFSLPLPTTSATRSEPSKDDTASTSASPDQCSKSNMNPVLTPDCVLTKPPGNTKPGDVTFGEPSVIRPAPSSSLFANITSNSGFANYNQPKSNLFGSRPPHLEAYIIRPTVQNTGSTTTLSYDDEPLRLQDAAMQAQMRSLGPEFSIVDELFNLHPQQLNLMQVRATTREGDIVSVQYGRPVDLQTVVGCMQVRPAIYIISTTTNLLPGRFGLFQQPLPTTNSLFPAGSDVSNVGGNLFDRAVTNFPAPNPGAFGSLQSGINNPAPGAAPRSLFGNSASGTNHSAPAPVNTSPGTGPFQSVRGPLIHIYNDFPGGAGSRSYYASPDAYSRHLQDKGEICTHIEPTESKDQFQHYQTLTANKEWHGKDQSLEEIRLADYKAGRRFAGSDQGKSLLAGLGSAGCAFPPSTAADASQAKWSPRPRNGDDTTFPPYYGRPGVFAGFTVDNSGKAPAFTNSSVWGPASGARAAFRPGLEPASSNNSPFGNQTQSLLAASLTSNPFSNDICTIEHTHSLFCRAPPENAGKSETASTSLFAKPPFSSPPKNPQQSVSKGLTQDPHPRFGPAVGASDPSDQTKWIVHFQEFCKSEHQHTNLCRVSPEEAAKVKRDLARTSAQPAVSRGFGQLAGSSSQDPFGAPSKSPFAAPPPQPSSGLFGGATSNSDNSPPPPASRGTLFGGGGALPSQQPPQTWPRAQLNHCFAAQLDCAMSAQPSDPLVRPSGLFGFSNASAPVAHSNAFGQTHQTAQSSGSPSRPLGGLFANSGSFSSGSIASSQPAQTASSLPGTTSSNDANPVASTSPYASSSQPVQATVVTPGTIWFGGSLGAPVIGKANVLHDHQQQLREPEERKREAMHAATLASRDFHDDAALTELIGSAKSAPVDDVIGGLGSDDRSEKKKEA